MRKRWYRSSIYPVQRWVAVAMVTRLSGAFISYHPSRRTLSDLISTDLLSSEPNALWSVAATANWVVHCEATQFAVSMTTPFTTRTRPHCGYADIFIQVSRLLYLWHFDLKVNVMDYISPEFGVDSLSRFPFRARTDWQTHRQLQLIITLPTRYIWHYSWFCQYRLWPIF